MRAKRGENYGLGGGDKSLRGGGLQILGMGGDRSPWGGEPLDEGGVRNQDHLGVLLIVLLDFIYGIKPCTRI